MHRAFELGVLLSGQEEKHSGGFTFRPQVGDAWLVPGCEVHAWRYGAPHASELTLHFFPEFLGDESFDGVSWVSLFACSPETRPMPKSDAVRKRVLATSRMLVEDLEARPPALVEGIRAWLLRVLFELYREWEHRSDMSAEAEQQSSRLGRIMPALNLVYSSPGRRVSLRDAAVACGFSYSYFDQVFRSLMGTAFAQFGRRTRLAHAARLSRHGKHPIESIAEECGFVDASHLQRRFLEFYGCTLREYSARPSTEPARGAHAPPAP
jgi:AraC-like DNA-binding protein